MHKINVQSCGNYQYLLSKKIYHFWMNSFKAFFLTVFNEVIKCYPPSSNIMFCGEHIVPGYSTRGQYWTIYSNKKNVSTRQYRDPNPLALLFFVSSCILYRVLCLTFGINWTMAFNDTPETKQPRDRDIFSFYFFAWTWTWTSKIKNKQKSKIHINFWKSIQWIPFLFSFFFLVYYTRQRTLSKDKVQAAGDSA